MFVWVIQHKNKQGTKSTTRGSQHFGVCLHVVKNKEPPLLPLFSLLQVPLGLRLFGLCARAFFPLGLLMAKEEGLFSF